VFSDVFRTIFAQGFFSSGPVATALLVGGIAAVVSGVVGAFTVMRGQAFAGHALADVSAAGGSAAFLLSISPLLGFLGIGVIAAGGMELIGIRRAQGRDLATGVVLGAGLGLAALLLYFDTTVRSTTGVAITVLFGSMFAIPQATIPLAAAVSLLVVAIVAVLYRPLLLTTVDPELAFVRGVPYRLVGVLFLIGLALAVALSALTIGAILSTALLIGPAATALRLSSRPAVAIIGAAVIGVASTWLGILLAYDSYYWPPQHHGWPVSFFVVAVIFAGYLLAQAPRASRRTVLSAKPAAPAQAEA
jgi:zinc/manganese transport system permease protein